jgi:lipopolysaccharide/colanic/teichoic acid biosynthesis glycosyltransferase
VQGDRKFGRESIWGRFLEFVVAWAAFIVSAPVAIAAALAVAAEDGFPVFYSQARVGKDGKIFHIRKIRSMKANSSGALLTKRGDDRVTRVGRFLRLYKLDELPQFWNVIRGDMAVVGPRPEVSRYVVATDPLWQEVLRLKPGITDLATLIYRNEEELLASAKNPEEYYVKTLLPEKLQLNLKYAQASSPLRNLLLIVLTIRYSLWPRGFNREVVERLLLPKPARQN